MIGWVILALGLSTPVALNLLVELWHTGENKRLPRSRWHPIVIQLVTMSIIALGSLITLGVTKDTLIAGLGAWGVSYLVREIAKTLQIHRDFQMFVMENNRKPR